MEIFKIKYEWYEGDSGETYLGKVINKFEFEENLKEALEFAKKLIGNEIEDSDYLGKGYRVECLPEFYNQIIWFLINQKGYTECSIDESQYYVDDNSDEKIFIEKVDEEIKRVQI